MPREDLRRLAPAAQATLRRQAVRLVRNGQPQVEVAALVGVSKQVMSRWSAGIGAMDR